MPIIVFVLFSVPIITTFTMLVFHCRLGGKVFTADLQLPLWWENILISFVGLIDPDNRFSSRNCVPILYTS